ncbi:MAG: outer membrane beta-barrel family protein [Muribaculaceae bacterium]|nr:outer membrane beta-barrel family protein [Muribaculaceae bacterium]
MDKIIYAVCCFCIISALCGYGKERKLPNEYTFLIEVRDNLTRRALDFAEVNITVQKDSNKSTIMGFTRDGEAEIAVPSGAVKYPIAITYRPNEPDKKMWEYETERIEYEVKNKYSRIQNVGTVYLKHKKQIELNEVSVTASKVMFYYKGDTLVYNADAFVLAQGTMLDGLISQMPGVELDRKGRIKVNGREVSSLLLNGKDLFNGNRQLMLENLAAYTVRDIAVYNKAGFESEALGINAGSNYVMDVRLKRQYKHGFLGNAETGYGTDNRYRAKLFGMWYSDNVGMTAFLSSNNLNDDAKPKPGYSDGSWSDLNPSAGTGSYHSGGITYNAEGPDRKWHAQGDAIVRYSDGTVRQTQTYEILIPGSEMYQYSWNDNRSKNLSISTSHTFKASAAKRTVFTLIPQFEYTKNRSQSSYLSASFNQEIADVSRSIIENIYTGETSYSQHLINRNLVTRLGRRNGLRLNADGSSLIKLNRYDGRSMLTLGAAAIVENQNSDEYTYRRLNFQAYPEQDYSMLQHNDQSPYRDREYKGYARFSQDLGFWNASLKLDYNFTRSEHTRTSLLYQDEIAQDFLTPAMLPTFGSDLPLDLAESYRSSEWENRHSLQASFSFSKRNPDYRKFSWGASIDVPLVVSQRKLDYTRGENGQHISSTNFLPEVNASFYGQWQPTRGHFSYTIGFTSSVNQPHLLNMVDVIDNTNPMNLMLGNPNLNNSRTNKVSINFAKQVRNPHHRVNISYSTINNAISQGLYYFLNTGQQISRPYNVDGNCIANASYTIGWHTYEKWYINNTIKGSFVRSRELIGSALASDADFDLGTAPPTNRVDNYAISEELDGYFKFGGKHTLKPFVKLTFRQYRSPNSAINNDMTFSGSYGASALLNFPYNWGLNTDLSLYTRRGYMDSRLNTTDVLWNARVTKSFINGNLVCAIEGYDLLRQLSNVSYTVNAQYRTETVTNVIPAYFLLSIKYNFNKQPNRN